MVIILLIMDIIVLFMVIILLFIDIVLLFMVIILLLKAFFHLP